MFDPGGVAIEWNLRLVWSATPPGSINTCPFPGSSTLGYLLAPLRGAAIPAGLDRRTVAGWSLWSYNSEMKFQAVFTYDEGYKGWVVEIPELPGCVSQGKTLDEASNNVRDAIQGVLKSRAENGDPYVPTGHGVFVGEIAV